MFLVSFRVYLGGFVENETASGSEAGASKLYTGTLLDTYDNDGPHLGSANQCWISHEFGHGRSQVSLSKVYHGGRR